MPDPASPSATVTPLNKQFRETPLYAIVDTALRPDLPPMTILEALLAGGVRVIQYRHKGKFGRANFDQCCRMAERTHQAGGIFIVNDRADVAALCGADGVHVGQEDLPPEKARAFLGAGLGAGLGGGLEGGKIVGYSTHHREQAALADKLPVDYIAIGPVFPTTTKQNPDPVVGLPFVTEVRRMTQKPLVAIGGITLDNAASVLRAGADAVAVASDLLRESKPHGTKSVPWLPSDIEKRVRQFLSQVRQGGAQ
jgi:thiamine-phosphate pyrophosphorylase